MSYFQVADDITVNPHAWNRVANMLYLESPAGAGQNSGFSTCVKGGEAVDCKWDDTSQAEAYAHTLLAFFKAFPEFKRNDFFLAGESYFGQYGPNIAHFILSNTEFSSINLVGMLVGNGCWGGTSTSVQCNGPNAARNTADIFYGKGLVSKMQYKTVYAACGFDSGDRSIAESQKCRDAQDEMHNQVGPYNVYDVYDNCPRTREYLQRTGKNMLGCSNRPVQPWHLVPTRAFMRECLLHLAATIGHAVGPTPLARLLLSSSAVMSSRPCTWVSLVSLASITMCLDPRASRSTQSSPKRFASSSTMVTRTCVYHTQAMRSGLQISKARVS